MAGACLVAAGAGASALVAAGGGHGSPALSSLTPAQVVAASLAAARHAGSFRVTWTVDERGLSAHFMLDTGPGGASLVESASGDGGSFRILVVGAETYLLLRSGSTGSMGYPSSVRLGTWYRLPPAEAAVDPFVAAIQPDGFLAASLATIGRLTFVRGPPGAPTEAVLLQAGGRNAAGATLTVSSRAPFYPVRLTLSEPATGRQTYVFSDWGALFDLRPPPGAAALPAPVGGVR